MTANFDRWEKDPFFIAAEEVQESADRMESAYRTWLHWMKDTSVGWNREDLKRELCTALDTARWQLDEFEGAVQTSYKIDGVDEAKNRHSQFILAMKTKISLVQKSLKESSASDGKPSSSPWVRMNEGERDELALFLSGPTEVPIGAMDAKGKTSSQAVDAPSSASGQNKGMAKDGKFSGHRRSASASADICSWNITMSEDGLASNSSTGQVLVPLRKVPSFSVVFGTTEPTAPKLKLPKNGVRKGKPTNSQKEDDIAFLRSQPQSRGTQACYERNKSCLDDCENFYDKQLHGWYGALHRLVQRSLYQVQHMRSMQTMLLVALLLFSMVLFLVRVL